MSVQIRFLDWNGDVLKTQTVEEGQSATAPSYPTREGYLCIGWDNDYSAVTSNLDITAQYIQEQGVPSDNIFPTFTGNKFNNYDSKVLQAKDHSISLSTPKGVGSIIMPLPTEWLDKELTITVGNKDSHSSLSIAGVSFHAGETHTVTPTASSRNLVFYTINVKMIWMTDLYATMPQEPDTHRNIYIGNTKVSNIYIGDNKITKVYLDNILIYENNSSTSISEFTNRNKS